jgi:hypothetical protein
MKIQRTPAKTAKATMGGTKKIGRPRERWGYEVEED